MFQNGSLYSYIPACRRKNPFRRLGEWTEFILMIYGKDEWVSALRRLQYKRKCRARNRAARYGRGSGLPRYAGK